MLSVLFERVVDGKLNFEQLEKLLWQSTLEVFRHLMAEVLERVDKELMKGRDKARYTNKEKNPRSIQTLVGSVDFKRRYYRDEQKSDWVYLLDEALDLEPKKTIGPGLLQLGVTWATKGPSYRDARDRLTDLFGAQVVSHEAIRQALLEVGAACEREQHNKIVTEDGKKEVQILFAEVDSFSVKIQKNRKSGRPSHRREAKLIVFHEGWAPRHNGKKPDYRLVNPTYICGFQEAEEFWEHARGVLSTRYRNIDKTRIIFNGDGAEWIRKGAESFGKGMYQYDRFHITRDVHSALLWDKKRLKKALKALRSNDMMKLIWVVTEAWASCSDANKKEELEELRECLLENHEYIVDYRKRLRDQDIEVPEEWRGLGSAESNVNKFKNRTGKRGRAWALKGVEAILTTQIHLFEGTLHENICRTLSEKEEWLLDRVTTGVGRMVKPVESGSTGIRRGTFPASSHGTRGFSKLFNRLIFVDVF